MNNLVLIQIISPNFFLTASLFVYLFTHCKEKFLCFFTLGVKGFSLKSSCRETCLAPVLILISVCVIKLLIV